MFKKLSIILCLSLSLVAGMKEIPKISPDSALKNLSGKTIAKIMADLIAKNLPMKLDEITTVTRVFSVDNTIYIDKVIDTESESLNGKNIYDILPTLRKIMFHQDRDIACNNVHSKFTITEKGVIYSQSYSDKKYKLLFRHTIEKEDCSTY
ncbi:MAG: hypothetical protein COA66_02600 [Arcobacter sp.]|nr:MAG: hypothetical protein COA66_14600 [Arcobacter sp.]PHR73964.1 MAG: hypothetical protein COA66_02600 [Arcobacter sp.]